MQNVDQSGESSARRALRVLVRTVGAAAGLLAAGLALGWLPVLVLCDGRLVVAADSGSFNLFAPGLLVGATFGAAVGAGAANGVLKSKVSFWEAFVGGLAGLAVGGLLELLYWITLNAVNPSLDGRLVWTISAVAIHIPIWAGAVIGSGWKVKPTGSPP